MLLAELPHTPLIHERSDLGGCSPLNPSQARLEVSRLVANQHLSEAQALSSEVLRQFPAHEEALVTRILVCEVSHQWQEAASLFQQLLELQADKAPAETWYHYVRVLACRHDTATALEVCQHALALHPDHAGLQAELASLLVSLGDLSSDIPPAHGML